jgi:flagellar assembly factor FliW
MKKQKVVFAVVSIAVLCAITAVTANYRVPLLVN